MFRFTIRPDDGDPWEVEATTRDVARWERTDKTASLHRLENEYRATDLYSIAYYAALRQGLFEGKLSDFQSSCDIEMTGEDEADPTRPAA